MVSGEPKHFNLSLSKASQNKKICDTTLSNDDSRWRTKILGTLQHNYSKAPMFDEIYRLVEGVIANESMNLSTVAAQSITKVFEYLDMEIDTIHSSVELSESVDLRKEKRLIKICKDLGAETYINAIGGRSLYTKEQFAEHDINLLFIEITETGLPDQGLSIIHLLMHHSKNDIKEALTKFILI
jgi:hypothetical protein